MIDYRSAVSGIESSQLEGFFEGWPDPPSPETHRRILEQSDEVVLAIERESGLVLGFITAISDRVLTAYIPLLEVRVEYRGRGIGSELVRRMLARLDDLYVIDLCCDAELQFYYEKLGMNRSLGMSIRNYGRQSGRRTD